jgi:hypothetical protein
MNLFIKKNPNPHTLLSAAYTDTCPEGYEPSTQEEADAWVSAQIAAGWSPPIEAVQENQESIDQRPLP